jgi:hypothetical protein
MAVCNSKLNNNLIHNFGATLPKSNISLPKSNISLPYKGYNINLEIKGGNINIFPTDWILSAIKNITIGDNIYYPNIFNPNIWS